MWQRSMPSDLGTGSWMKALRAGSAAPRRLSQAKHAVGPGHRVVDEGPQGGQRGAPQALADEDLGAAADGAGGVELALGVVLRADAPRVKLPREAVAASRRRLPILLGTTGRRRARRRPLLVGVVAGPPAEERPLVCGRRRRDDAVEGLLARLRDSTPGPRGRGGAADGAREADAAGRRHHAA